MRTFKASIAMRLRLSVLLFVAVLASAFSPLTEAKCSKNTSATRDGVSDILNFGSVNVASTYLMPVGSLLGTYTALAQNTPGWNSETVLYTCLQTDLPYLYYLVATNGDDRVGGYYFATEDGLPDVAKTYFAYVGIKLTMSGVVLSRYYKQVPITSYEVSGSNILIKAKHIPPLVAQLYRISTLPGTSAKSSYCGNDTSGYVSTSGKSYTCTQPNAYVQLAATSPAYPNFNYAAIGSDSATNWRFWDADQGLAYGMRTGATLYLSNTCVARSVTPVVMFSTISTAELNAGKTRTQDFQIEIECNNSGVTSGTATGQTAIGIQASQGAYDAAVSNGLSYGNAMGYLLSDNYGSPGIAQGVGITLVNKGTGTYWYPQSPTASKGGGATSGWYPALAGAVATTSKQSGYMTYRHTIQATLLKLPSRTPTAGRVYSTAYVQVMLQ